jgi:catechol 2,3-dioxygenase-like lactoylglutathione lyase family enzyme
VLFLAFSFNVTLDGCIDHRGNRRRQGDTRFCSANHDRGAMHMRFSANNELALHVADPALAERFYTETLGCVVVERSPDCIALTSGAMRLYLLRDPHRSHDAVVPSFDVPSRAAALEYLQASGCALVPIGPHAPGEFYLRDPHGVIFDVVEHAGQKPPAA